MVKLQRETAKKAADKMKAGVRVARRSVVAFGNVASQAVGNTNKAGMMALSNVRGSVAVARGSVANAAGRKKRGGPGSVPLPLQIEASGSDEGSASKSRGRPSLKAPMALKEKLLVVCSCLRLLTATLCKKLEKTFALVCLGQDDPSKPPRTIPGAPWLEVGPGWWLESEASRRGRCARNHVKTMVRGRKDYHVYKSRQGESFFYPQRLWDGLRPIHVDPAARDPLLC